MRFRLFPVLRAEAVGIISEIKIDERNTQLRMVGRAVIALPVVLHRELPIALLDDVQLVCDLGVPDIIGRKSPSHDFLQPLDIFRRIVGKTDIDQAADRLEVDGLQAPATLVEVLPHMRGITELTRKLVGPLVVGADQLGNDG